MYTHTLRSMLCMSLLLLASTFFATTNTFAQCDTCTSSWGAPQYQRWQNVTLSTKSAVCQYEVVLTYQTRVCNGITQIRVVDLFIGDLTNNPLCQLYCWEVGAMLEAAYKQVVNTLGQQVEVYSESSCYYAAEVDLPQQLLDCFQQEQPGISSWWVVLPCDDNGCCKFLLTPLGNGQVQQDVIVTTACPVPNPNNPPAAVTVTCYPVGGGAPIIMSAPLKPGQPLTCETYCDTRLILKSSTYDDSFVDPRTINGPLLAEVSLYPNPVQDNLNISFGNTTAKTTVRIEIYTLSGESVSGKNANVSANQVVSFDTKTWAKGTYVCKVFAGSFMRSFKFVK